MLTEIEKNIIINSAKEDYEDYGACHNGDDVPDIMGDLLDTKSKAKKKEAADFFKELSNLGAEEFYNRYKDLDWSDEFKKDFGKSKINKPSTGMSVPRILKSIGKSEENNYITDMRIESAMYGTSMSPQEAIAQLNYNSNYNYKPTGDLVKSPDGIWISKYEYKRKYLQESVERNMHDMLTEEEKDYIIETAQMDYECGGCTYSDDFYDIMSEILDTDDEEKIAAGIEFYQELAELGPAGMLQEYPELDWSDDYKAEYGEFDDDDVEEECYDYIESRQSDINKAADWFKVSQIEGLMYMNKGMTAEEAKAELGIDPSYVYVPTGNLKHPSFQESKKNFKESLKRKDGVYILSGGGLNADYNYLEVWKDGEMIEKTDNQYHTSKEHDDSVFGKAQELAKKHNLKIFDGTGVSWSVFSSRFHRNNKKDGSPFVKKGAEWVEYSDQDMDDMDTRPKVTTKWAICTSPGKFDIYDNVQKNPEKYYDTDQFRGFAGRNGDRVGELKKFFDENADKIYQGTFDDIKDGQYTVVVNGRIYQSNTAGKMINTILDAGLEFDGKRVTGQVNFGKRRNRYDDYYEDIVEISCSCWLDESKMDRLTQIYDVLTMVGIDVPNEFAFSSEDEPKYMVVVDSNKNLHLTSSSAYKNSQGLKVGDIVELERTFPYEYRRYSGDSSYSPLFVVIETDGVNAKLAQCSDVKLTYESRSLYDSDRYEVKFNQGKYDDALKGLYYKEDMKNINLLHTQFKVVTKNFRLAETFNRIYLNRF